MRITLDNYISFNELQSMSKNACKKLSEKYGEDLNTETQSENDIAFSDDALDVMLRQVVCKHGYWVNHRAHIIYMTDFKLSNNDTVSHWLNSKGLFITSKEAEDGDFAIVCVYCSRDGDEIKNVTETPLIFPRKKMSVLREAYSQAIRGGAERVCV